MGVQLFFVRQMHTSTLGVYQLLSIISLVFINSSPSPMSAKLCSMSVHRSVQKLELNCLIKRLTPVFVLQKSQIWEGCGRRSVKCTPPTLISINSSPSQLSAKLCSMNVHRFVHKLEFSCLIKRLTPIYILHKSQIWEG